MGSALSTGLAQNLIGTPVSLLSVTGLNRVLAPSTTYYLVAAGTTLTDIPDPDPSEPPQPGYLGWNMTDTATSGLSGVYASTNSGTTWSVHLYTSPAADHHTRVNTTRQCRNKHIQKTE